MTLKEQIIKEILKPNFKENGFKISGNHYRKVENGFIKVFNPQFSMFNDSENVRLTFNMGLYFPETTKFENRIEPKKLSCHDCQFEERYGHLCTDSGNDYWIEKNDSNTVEEFENEIKDSVEKSIKWFNQFDSIESLKSLRNHKYAWNAYRINYDIALFALKEDTVKALDIIKNEIANLEGSESNWTIRLKESYEKIKTVYNKM
tara:strand:- start:85 stop:696 length:612 start_codon:yes stop_codon:yes gene_type:complete